MRVNTGLYRFVRLGMARSQDLKSRCPKGRAGSTPALGTILNLSDVMRFHLALSRHKLGQKAW